MITTEHRYELHPWRCAHTRQGGTGLSLSHDMFSAMFKLADLSTDPTRQAVRARLAKGSHGSGETPTWEGECRARQTRLEGHAEYSQEAR